MAGGNNSRRDMGIVVAIAIGLIIGIFIKRVHIGLLIGLGIGLLSASLISGRRK
ncbi:MAG TPA: hypothetical protein VIK80_03235 [Flavihumibacter sp.]|jgi:hypothetical protein